MAQPSSLQILGGPLGGRRFEFRGSEALIGSGPECNVRIEADGVEGNHARIVVEITGATIFRVDGVVGVNDDVVMGDALLRSGDFVWIGEPAGPNSLMLQFTLGDVDETADAASVAAPVAAAAAIRTIEPPSDEIIEQSSDELTEETPTLVGAFAASPQEAAQEEVVEEVLQEEAPAEALHEEFSHEPAAVLEEMPDPVEAEAPAMEEAPELEPAFEAHESEAPFVTESPDADFAPAPASPSHESPFDDDMEPSAAPEGAKVVPPAPWQMATPTPEPAPAQEYAMAWESAPKPVEAPAPDLEEVPAPPPPPPPVARAAPAATTAEKKRPAVATQPKVKIRTVEQDAALRTPPPPPPARTTSSTPVVLGGLVALVVLAIAGFFLLRPAAPVETPPPPTPVATPVPMATAEATASVEATPEPTPVPVVEATPAPTVAAPATPTPRAAATPTPRTTPTPRATPTPKATPTPAGARPVATPVPTTAAPVAPVSQAPRLLEEARAAITARDFPKASQLLDEVLRVEPGNGEATTRKAEVTARLAALNRKFSVGATTVIGGKTAKGGPAGFDLGGGGVVQTDFSAQIRCATTPATLEAGMPYSVRCSITNIGKKPFKIDGVTVNETADGAKIAGAGTASRGDIAPQADAVVLEKSGTWSARSQWTLELVAKTSKDESFRAVYSWR